VSTSVISKPLRHDKVLSLGISIIKRTKHKNKIIELKESQKQWKEGQPLLALKWYKPLNNRYAAVFDLA
jgi:hypothetical protein